jgi:hypothetical protein
MIVVHVPPITGVPSEMVHQTKMLVYEMKNRHHSDW